jgi:hypothetical protein
LCCVEIQALLHTSTAVNCNWLGSFFCNSKHCVSVVVYQRFGTAYRPYLHGSGSPTRNSDLILVSSWRNFDLLF